MRGFEFFAQADWLLLVALFIAAVISFFFSVRMFHRARLIEDMPTSKIRSATQGYVELYGTAKWLEGPEIIAPLTNTPCTWYSFSIEERSGYGRNEHWRTIDSGISEELFLLEDETGTCVIDPEGADVTPSARDSWYGSSPSGVATNSLLGTIVSRVGGKYRYSEQRLNVNEPLYAIGEFNSVGTDFRKNIDESVRDFLSKLKRDKRRLANYDTNQDGEIDQQEWELARKDAKLYAQQEQLNNPLPRATHVLKKPKVKKYQPFLLSAKSETALTRKNRFYSYGLSLLFIAIVVGIFYKLLGKI